MMISFACSRSGIVCLDHFICSSLVTDVGHPLLSSPPLHSRFGAVLKSMLPEALSARR